MTKLARMPLAIGIAAALALGILFAGRGVGALERAPETVVRCICVDGALIEWREGSTVGPPGRGGLDWQGAGSTLGCRPEPLPVGAPGERLNPLGAKR